MTVTVCWSAKGGSGTTVVAATLALSNPAPTTLVDLDGELPSVLGLPEPVGQGIADWLAADAASPAAVDDLVIDVDRSTGLVPRGRGAVDAESPRWPELVTWWAERGRPVIVDAGSGPPPAALFGAGTTLGLLVTRACYLSLRRAVTMAPRPDGVVLVEEPGRALRARDVEAAIGAPVIARISIDPAVARAVDAGLLAARVPRLLRREIRTVSSPPALELVR